MRNWNCLETCRGKSERCWRGREMWPGGRTHAHALQALVSPCLPSAGSGRNRVREVLTVLGLLQVGGEQMCSPHPLLPRSPVPSVFPVMPSFLIPEHMASHSKLTRANVDVSLCVSSLGKIGSLQKKLWVFMNLESFT